MNLKLEELRRRLLEPTGNAQNPNSSVYKRSSAELYAANQRVSETKEADWVMSEESAGASREQPIYEPIIAPTLDGKPAAAANPGAVGIREAVVRYAEKAGALPNPGDGSMGGDNQYQVAQAVAKAFEQIRSFEERFAELTRTFEPIDGLGQSAAKSLAPLATFRDQLTRLARTFEPMRAFQAQLAELAQSMEAMQGLQYQLALLSDAFAVNLRQASNAIQPAIEFRAMLLKLAASFDSAAELQASFAELATVFHTDRLTITPPGESATANRLDA